MQNIGFDASENEAAKMIFLYFLIPSTNGIGQGPYFAACLRMAVQHALGSALRNHLCSQNLCLQRFPLLLNLYHHLSWSTFSPVLAVCTSVCVWPLWNTCIQNQAGTCETFGLWILEWRKRHMLLRKSPKKSNVEMNERRGYSENIPKSEY